MPQMNQQPHFCSYFLGFDVNDKAGKVTLSSYVSDFAYGIKT